MTANDERELLAVAREAAEAAADELRARFGGRARGVRTKSGPTDLVSDADFAAESAIRSVLGARRPGDAILGEEGGETGEGELRWVVDPLDGTINYLYRIPAFAVSIAVEDGSGTLAGVVLDPIAEERFEATRSGEPMLNGEPIRPDGRAESLDLAMVATGFNYDAAVRARQADVVRRLLPRVRDIRRVGAAALDLCWCAVGRYDAYFERGLNSWDVAAGSLIASRAGLTVRDLAADGGGAGGDAGGAGGSDRRAGRADRGGRWLIRRWRADDRRQPAGSGLGDSARLFGHVSGRVPSRRQGRRVRRRPGSGRGRARVGGRGTAARDGGRAMGWAWARARSLLVDLHNASAEGFSAGPCRVTRAPHASLDEVRARRID